jgi:hypothetical protein
MLCNHKQWKEKNLKEGRKFIQPVAASKVVMTCSKSVNKLTTDVIKCFCENFCCLSPVADIWCVRVGESEVVIPLIRVPNLSS